MNFTELTEYLAKIDHNLIPDCEIAVYKDHKCIYKNSFCKLGYNSDEAKKDMYFLFRAFLKACPTVIYILSMVEFA